MVLVEAWYSFEVFLVLGCHGVGFGACGSDEEVWDLDPSPSLV